LSHSTQGLFTQYNEWRDVSKKDRMDGAYSMYTKPLFYDLAVFLKKWW